MEESSGSLTFALCLFSRIIFGDFFLVIEGERAFLLSHFSLFAGLAYHIFFSCLCLIANGFLSICSLGWQEDDSEPPSLFLSTLRAWGMFTFFLVFCMRLEVDKRRPLSLSDFH
jgi:succinate-acetate transporter protein